MRVEGLSDLATFFHHSGVSGTTDETTVQVGRGVLVVNAVNILHPQSISSNQKRDGKTNTYFLDPQSYLKTIKYIHPHHFRLLWPTVVHGHYQSDEKLRLQ